MPIELKLLVWAVLLTLAQCIISALGATLQVGLPRLAGNREHMPEFEGWVGRAQRAHGNMLESLVLFAALVLVAQVSGKTNAMTALGAQIFFWSRLIYVPVYIAGIAWVRTGLWSVSILGLILMLVQLL